jgi:uncharacterized protein
MTSAGTIVQHGLVCFLVVVAPLWDRYEIPRLKSSTDPRQKIRFYAKIVAASWVCAIVAALTVGLATVVRIPKRPGEVAWLDPGTRSGIFLQGLTAGILIALIVPAVLALWSEKIRRKAGKAARKLAFLLPSTPQERRWWWLVCVTAGISEEIVYRGFLLDYFHGSPFHGSLTWALVGSSVVFGIGHLYQGLAGAVQTSVIGFLFGAIFLATGNLLLPVLLHAFLDLRVLALLPVGFETAEF